MKKLAIILTILTAFLIINSGSVFATKDAPAEKDACNPQSPADTSGNNVACGKTTGLFCKVTNPGAPTVGTCQQSADLIGIARPTKGFATLGDAVSKVLIVAFAVAVLVVLVMLILGAFEWITSGGDKEAVGKARGRIINALIGLAVLAIAFALANVAARFTGLDLFNINIPSPDPNAPGL